MGKTPTDNMPFVSVIVPVYNDLTHIGTTIEALLHQTYPSERYEIIVVDNGSTDATPDLLKKHSNSIVLLEEKATRGSYAARNRGIKKARGEILAFTDSDCRPFPNWLSAGVNTLRETKASVVGGEVEFCFSERRTGAEYVDAVINMRNEKSIRERGVGKTANLFVVRSVFERIGLFPNHLASGGDVYYTAKTTAAGYRIRYSPEARVKHPTRFLGALLRKEFRTGIGKTSIHLLGVHPGLHGTSGMRSGALSQINPLKLHTSLQSEGYNVSFLKFLRILIAFYAVLVAAFLGEVYGYSFYLQRGSENL